MEEFAKNFALPSWWVGVVVVGILLNVVSAYLKPALDRALSAISRSWRDRSEARRVRRAKVIAELKADRHKQLLVLASEARHQSRGIVFLLFSLILFLGYTNIGTADLIIAFGGLPVSNAWHRHVFLGAAVLMFFFSFYERAAANQCKALVLEAQDELLKC